MREDTGLTLDFKQIAPLDNQKSGSFPEKVKGKITWFLGYSGVPVIFLGSGSGEGFHSMRVVYAPSISRMTKASSNTCIRISQEVVDEYKERGNEMGWAYQTLMKSVLEWGLANWQTMDLRPPKRGSLQEHRSQVGFVYFAQSADSEGTIKIGFSTQVEKRLIDLQRDCAFPLRLLVKVPGTMIRERVMHVAFWDHRVDHEWFLPHPDLLSYIERLKVDQWADPASAVHDDPVEIGMVALLCCRCRCGHEWRNRSGERSVVCPKCKSPNWDRPLMRQVKPPSKGPQYLDRPNNPNTDRPSGRPAVPKIPGVLKGNELAVQVAPSEVFVEQRVVEAVDAHEVPIDT